MLFAAFLILSLGIVTLLKGKLHYVNYWGGTVFAPVTIVVGLLLLVGIIFKWEKFGKKHEK